MSVRIEFDLDDADAMAQIRAHTNVAVEDTVAWFRRRQGLVDFGGVTEDHVRYIARAAARLALLVERNPDCLSRHCCASLPRPATPAGLPRSPRLGKARLLSELRGTLP
jgi:hypothetical protein